MKRLITTASAIIALSLSSWAQTSLPYTTGFDNTAQKAGWQTFRNGCDTFNNWMYETDYAAGFTPPSAPDCINHDYPTGGTLTDDWLISPQLDMTAGASVGLNICIYDANFVFGGGGLIAGDTAELYLLSGSPNPTLATRTLLASFSHQSLLAQDYAHFKDSSGIIVPATTGNCYLAFRYSCINDWFAVGIDDIQVTPLYKTAVSTVNNANTGLSIYPNPVKETLQWSYADLYENEAKGQIIDASGRLITTFPLRSKQLDVQFLKPGTYFLKSETGTIPFTKE